MIYGTFNTTPPTLPDGGQAPLQVGQNGRLLVSGDGAGSMLPAGTDRSGAIATGGQFQLLMPANANRKKGGGQNLSTGDQWVREQLTAQEGAGPTIPGSRRIGQGGTFQLDYNAAVWIWGATTGQAFSADEG